MIHHTDFTFTEPLITRKKNKYIVVHHVGKRGSFTVEDIHQMHLHRKPPMAGIGYHYYVRKNGEIYEGRPRWKKWKKRSMSTQLRRPKPFVRRG